MKMCGRERTRESSAKKLSRSCVLLVSVLLRCPWNGLNAQTADPKVFADQIAKLNEAMARTQAQLEESQRELNDMQAEVATLRSMLEKSGGQEAKSEASDPSTAKTDSAALQTAIHELRERQEMAETQIATHEQSKVESESKYPVKVTGLVLMNGFVNTRAVDSVATPSVALAGSGSSGATVRQTIIGVDARGPHVLGAQSYADLRVDFDGLPSNTIAVGNYSGYYSAAASLLRLRTAHAGLQWQRSNLVFSLDRSILSPDSPTSLTAVAIPSLAWSGNLWTWNPQVVATYNFDLSSTRRIALQGALTDIGDAPLAPPAFASLSVLAPPSTAEQSRWPGLEARVALLGVPASPSRAGDHLGVGGLFEPHESAFLSRRFDSWAVTLDAGRSMPKGLELDGNFYRGQGLGGLGAGAYKDIVFKPDLDGTGYYSQVLDDVGGWAQMKERFSQRLQLNAAFGIDNVFAGELRGYYFPSGTIYQNLAKNRTYTGNVIFNPTAYLMFSVEYRHLASTPVVGSTATSDVIGLAAGYRF